MNVLDSISNSDFCCGPNKNIAPIQTPIPTSPPPTPTPTPTPTETPTPTVTYFYYSVRKFDCNNFCTQVTPDVVGRSSTALSTSNGLYYKVGSFTYQLQTEVLGPTYDVNLDGAPSNSDCATACTTNYTCPSVPGSCYATLAECEAAGCINCAQTVCAP